MHIILTNLRKISDFLNQWPSDCRCDALTIWATCTHGLRWRAKVTMCINIYMYNQACARSISISFSSLLQSASLILMLRRIFIVAWLVLKCWSESILVSRLNACSTDKLDPEMAIISLARRQSQRLGSLFLYWKIFAYAVGRQPHGLKKECLDFRQNKFHSEIDTVKLTLWDHCNMIGPFTTFEFSSQNVLDRNHDVLVIRRYKDVLVFNLWNFLQRKCGSAWKSQPCKKTTKNGLWRAMERTPYLPVPQACEEVVLVRLHASHWQACIILWSYHNIIYVNTHCNLRSPSESVCTGSSNG